MKILQHNVETNKVIERDATPDEVAEMQLSAARRKAQLAEAEAKAEAKLEAQAKLAALGLTVEDLTALGL